MKLAWPLFLFVAICSPLHAETAHQLYVDGKFAEAESAALAEGGAAGYALAARSVLAAEVMRPEPCGPCLAHAQDLAQHAIDSDPRLVEGQIEFVVALGYRARLIGALEANFKGFAKKAKDHIDAALADDPANAWAWAALGGWNIEIAHDAGATLARWLYGANMKSGLEDFEKAFAAAPDNLVVRYQYALTLAACDRDSYRAAIVDALTRAAQAVPQSAYESFAQANARELLAALKSADMQTFDRLVRHDQGYP